jgi:hypothetical protein
MGHFPKFIVDGFRINNLNILYLLKKSQIGNYHKTDEGLFLLFYLSCLHLLPVFV